MRVLEWIIGRCKGEVSCADTPVGRLPDPNDLRLDGIQVTPETMKALLEIDVEAWKTELADIGEYLDSFGDRTPADLRAERERVAGALDAL